MSVAAVKEHDISDAAGMDNVDRAAKHLQDIAGITTGDVASHYLNEEKWNADHDIPREFNARHHASF